MTVCDWCKSEGKMLYDIYVSKSTKYEDKQMVQLCRQCLTVLEKHVGKAFYNATIAAKAEVEGEKLKKKRRWCFR